MKNKNNKKKKYIKSQINDKLDQILYSQKLVIKNQEKCEYLINGINDIDEYVIEQISPIAFLSGNIESNYLIDKDKKIKRVKVLKNDSMYIKLFKYIKSHPRKLITTLLFILINYFPKLLDVDLTLIGLILELMF